jgi:hypothetical protein
MRKLLILIAAGVFLVAFTVPAIAAEWNFNGRVAFRTFYVDDSEEAAQAFKGFAGKYSDTDLYWGRYCDNWIGATVKAGDITGNFMYRPLEAHPTIGSGDFAQLSASWNFGGGSLLIGKDLGPVNYFPSGQVYLDDMGLVGFGGIFTYFKPLMQLSVGGFKVALAEPETSTGVVMIGGNPSMTLINNPWLGGYFTRTGADNVDTTIPKIEASYSFTAGPVSLSVMGGYQTYDEKVTATDKTYGIDSYILGLGFKIPVGLFYVNGDIFKGQNLGQYQMTFQQGMDDAAYDATYKDEIIDNYSMGYCLVVGYKISDVLTLEVGYGYVEHQLDRPGWETDDTASYYAQMPINVAPGVQITPEIGMVDWGDGVNALGKNFDEGSTTYYGARWQICF